MTHAVSLLYWLSTGLYDVLPRVTTSSTTTLHSALLVGLSTVLFSRQTSRLSSGLTLSLAHPANGQLDELPLSTSSARIC